MAATSSPVRRSIRWIGRAIWAAITTGADLGPRGPEREPGPPPPARSVRRRR